MEATGAFQEGVLTKNFLPKLMPHHRQGTLDGACGFYSVSMILDYFGICNPGKDVGDRRTNTSRLLQHLSRDQPLLEKGLHLKELQEVVTFFPKTPLRFRHKASGNLEQLRRFLRSRVRRGIPAILSYSGGPDYQHFAVVVGVDRESIYLMDPGENHSDGMLYNEWLRLYRHGGRLKAKDSCETPVQVGACIAFWPKGWNLGRKKRRAEATKQAKEREK